MLTPSQIQDHLDDCADGAECQFRTAQAWAESVAAPGHANEIRDLVMTLHLAEIQARDHLESVQLLTSLTSAIVRREPTKKMKIERSELIERIERLVIEHDDNDQSVDLTLVQKPDGDGSLS